MKRIILLLAALVAALFSCSDFSFAGQEILGSSIEIYRLNLWHYSGGYWIVGNTEEDKITIYDEEVEFLGGIESFLDSNMSADFTVSLPPAALSAAADGWEVRWQLRPRSMPLDELFRLSTLSGGISEGELRFELEPKFNLVSDTNLNDIVSGISKPIPLIDYTFGSNLYSVFGNGLSAVQGRGWYDEDAPEFINSPYMHPRQIKDSSGALHPGFTVFVGGEAMDSEGLSVGSGTLSGGGACGLEFVFPLEVVFYIETENEPEDPGEDTPSEPPEEEPEISVSAKLQLPEYSYVGHPVIADDLSVITVDEETLSAARAYAQGLASSSLSADAGGMTRIRKIDSTTAELVFGNEGRHGVQLRVRARGASDRDRKFIEIRPVPDVKAYVGGTQKQNRKQTLNISAAQNPESPITKVDILLQDEESGEEIRTCWTIEDGPCTSLGNSENIKYRVLKDRGSDEYFVRLSLEFLSRFGSERSFSYEALAVSGNGDSASASGEFKVLPDLPPEAHIDIEPAYLREEGSNIAKIKLSDASRSDGDLLIRTWTYDNGTGVFSPMPGYNDLSFGSGQLISFLKEGVGEFRVRLDLREEWTEETLEEYVNPEDRLTASAAASSEVINIAPHVSLELRPVKTADVLILAEDADSLEAAEEGIPILKKKLLGEGIYADVKTGSLAGCEEESGNIIPIGTLETAFGFRGAWETFWDKYSATADDERIFKAEAIWPAASDYYECYPEQPYTIRAYSAGDLSPLWNFSISESLLAADDLGFGARYGHDGEGLYLYFMMSGSTLIIDKESGQLVAKLPFTMGYMNAVTEECIYSFKADGIYRILRESGSVMRILNEKIHAGIGEVVKSGGKYLFLSKHGTELFKAEFSPEDESLRYTRLEGTYMDPGGAVTNLVGFDCGGATAINTRVSEKDYSARVFAADGRLIREVQAYSPFCYPVRTSSGEIRALACYSESHIRNVDYTVTAKLARLYVGEDGIAYLSDDEDWPTEPRRPIIGLEKPDGTILAGLGANYDFVWSLGKIFHERLKIFRFGNDGRAAIGDGNFLAPGVSNLSEYGQQYPGLLLITITDSVPLPSAYNKTFAYKISESREDKMTRLSKAELSWEKDYTFVTAADEDFDALELAGQLASEALAGPNALMISSGNGEGAAIKEYCLKPDTTYYYEYDTNADSDILTISAELIKEGTASEGYTVTEIYTEDFNDDEMNPFFTIVKGTVKDARLCLAECYKCGGDFELSGEIAFEIPEGRLGLLNFDFEEYISGSSVYGCFFTLKRNEEEPRRWEDGTNGFYGSKRLLLPGSYRLRGVQQHSAPRNVSSRLHIDNINVMLLEKRPNYPEGGTRMPDRESSVENTRMRHVEGSFRTPRIAGAYGLSSHNHVKTDVTGDSYVFPIPENSYAPYISASLISYPYYNSNTERGRSVRWLLDGRRWNAAHKNAYFWERIASLSREDRISVYGKTGPQSLTRENVYQTFGEIDSVEYVYASPGSEIEVPVSEGRFFIDDGLYYEDLRFNGKTYLSFEPGMDIVFVNNLKLYCIEGNRKVYAEDSSFRAPDAAKGWTASNAFVGIEAAGNDTPEMPGLVFNKGEYISYDFLYTDYERDASKASFYEYTHMPMNDGLAEFSGRTLTSEINRFYKDGKYILRHRQIDNTGKTSYDLMSNTCEIVFYIAGAVPVQDGNNPPKIERIATLPASDIGVGDSWSFKVHVSDKDGDELSLAAEVYHSSDRSRPAFSFTRTGLLPGLSGSYSEEFFNIPKDAEEGRYDIIVTVSDGKASGLKSYSFVVRAIRSLNGNVEHTALWESKRTAFNYKWKGKKEDAKLGGEGWIPESPEAEEFKAAFAAAAADYSAAGSPRLRYKNVFWPGEQLVLAASCGGDPLRVSAKLLSPDGSERIFIAEEGVSIDLSAYKTLLTPEGPGYEKGETLCCGKLWAAGMRDKLKTRRPLPLLLRFSAFHRDGETLEFDVPLIFDLNIGYERLHRRY